MANQPMLPTTHKGASYVLFVAGRSNTIANTAAASAA